MEISSVPFLSQEDFSHFYNNLFPEMEEELGVNSISNESRKRRRRNDEQELEQEADHNGEGLKGDAIKGILTSLLLLEDEERQEQREREFQFFQEKTQIDSSFDRESQAMSDYAGDMQQHFSQLNNLDQSRTRRVRRMASAAAAAAVASTSTAGAANSSDGPGGHHRRLWVKDRSRDWWDQRNHPDFPEEQFKKDFRMSRATFEFICDELDAAVTKKNTMLREAIPVRQRVAVCIWRLATGEPLRLVSKRFGLGISTCHKLVLEVCSAIRSVMMPKYLKWPTERADAIKEEFEAMSGIKSVVGAMYTTHVPIIAPKVNVSAYFNRRHTERNQKTSYSITLQGVVDARGVFSDICIGWPGSMPDDQVLEKSALCQRANLGQLKDVWIVGNAGYPLLDWLLVPYTRQNLTWAQHAFNERVGEVQKVAREAFARLKGRWACLQKRTEVKLQDLPVVLGACCILHNICEMRNEEIEPEYKIEIFDDEMIAAENTGGASSGAVSVVMQKRDQIAHNLLHHGLAGTSFLYSR